MNEIVNKLLLTGDKLMPELHLRQPGFTYLLIVLAGRLFNIKKKIQNFKETSDLNYIYKNELGKACFAYDTAYADCKNSAQINISDKVLKDRASKIALS